MDVERMDENNWVKESQFMNVEGVTKRGRPRRTWDQVV